MKKIFLVLVTIMVLSLSACVDDSVFVKQRAFSSYALLEISPEGLVFGRSAGKNWWEGEYKGNPVLIHAIVTSSYVNVEFQYVDNSVDK